MQQGLAQQASQLPDEQIAQQPSFCTVRAAAVMVHIEATSIAASIHTFVFMNSSQVKKSPLVSCAESTHDIKAPESTSKSLNPS